jgi:hypothetical protein
LLGMINHLIGHGRFVPKGKLGHPDIVPGLIELCSGFSDKFRIGCHRSTSLL